MMPTIVAQTFDEFVQFSLIVFAIFGAVAVALVIAIIYTRREEERTERMRMQIETQNKSSAVPKPVLCRNCGAQNEADAAFCKKCGKQM